MDRRETVKRAIHFGTPDRIPVFLFSGNACDTDIVQVVLERWDAGESGRETEWGFLWQKSEQDTSSMGVPQEYLLKDWDNYENYVNNIAPDPYDKERFEAVRKIEKGDRYLMGSLYLSGFTVMSFLRRFELLMIDMYDMPERVEQVADIVFGFENEIIRQMPEYGFDGVSLFDDWGMQQSMMISPELWRKYFKKRYADQFALVHSLGMDVFFHTCGYVAPIIEDLIEAGVDILNLGQADINDMNMLKEKYNGRLCFCQPINYQTTGISGTKEEIYAEAREIKETFACKKGGLIAELFDYEEMGWQPENPRNTEYQIRAFEEIR